MVFSKRLTQEKKQSFVNVEEAYTLWGLLNSKNKAMCHQRPSKTHFYRSLD